MSIILTLSSCGFFGGSPEPEPEPKPVQKHFNIAISASETLNPNLEKRASPVVVRIYQLSQIDEFNNSDFFALYENDKNVLAQDLVYKKELDIKPAQNSIISVKIESTAKYIAVFAAFRDLDKAQWKSFIQIDPLNLQPLKVEINNFSISVSIDSDK